MMYHRLNQPVSSVRKGKGLKRSGGHHERHDHRHRTAPVLSRLAPASLHNGELPERPRERMPFGDASCLTSLAQPELLSLTSCFAERLSFLTKWRMNSFPTPEARQFG